MRFTHSLKIILLTSLVVLGTQTTFAEEDPLNQEVQNLFAMPTKVTTTTTDGDTVETFVSTGTSNAVGTIKKPNGSIIQFTRTSSAGGSMSYSFNEGGVTTTAVQDANGNVSGNGAGNVNKVQTGDSQSKPTELKTITSEMVPGADCVCYKEGGYDCTTVEKRKYICTTGTGITGFQQVIAKIIRFIINIVLLLGVLAVVGLGIAWSFAGGDDVKMKSTLKTWAINIIVGLLILFMFGYILRFLAPWVYN